jgi:hypothetical protein
MSAAVEAAAVGAREVALIDAVRAVAAVERAAWDRLERMKATHGPDAAIVRTYRDEWYGADKALAALKAVG